MHTFPRIFLLALLTTAFSSANGNWVIALKPDKDPDAMLEERRLLESQLSEHIGKPVQVIVPMSGAVILEGLANGTIDLAWVSAMDMLQIQKQGAGEMLLAGTNKGKTGYSSYWVVRDQSEANEIEGLKGKPVAFSSRTSTSGFLIPLLDLHQRGLLSEAASPEVFFGEGNVWFGTGYVSAIERLLSGDAEAAAVSAYVIDGNRHLTPEQKSKIRVLQSQGPVPTHVLAGSNRISWQDRKFLADKLRSFDADALQGRVDLFANPLVEVDVDSHLEPVKKALDLTAPAQ